MLLVVIAFMFSLMSNAAASDAGDETAEKIKTSVVHHTSAKACALSPCYTMMNSLHPTQQAKSLRIREKHR